jgi:CRP-like cAMP-binding protein
MVSSGFPTSLMTQASTLNDHPCFSACSRKALGQLRRHGSCIAVAPGVVVQPCQPTRWVYFVLSGALSLDTGMQAWLVGAGGTIGLRAAFGENAPTLAIEAASTTLVYVIGVHELRAVATANPSLLGRLATHLARHPVDS